MEQSLYDFQHYKAYLDSAIRRYPRKGRGLRSEMAKILRCHSGYISQVLGGEADFSLEQGQALNRFFNHNAEESHFFLTLIQWNRAGTADLKDYFRNLLDELLDKRKDLKTRLRTEKKLTAEETVVYFSHWHYAAIHAFLAVPGGKTIEEIVNYLQVSAERVVKVLSFLKEVGLAEIRNQRYHAGSTQIHLGSDSPLVIQHHSNWRLQAVTAMSRGLSEDLHYSSVIAISAADYPRIREILVQSIEAIRGIVKDSKEEEVYCYLLDLFPVSNNISK